MYLSHSNLKTEKLPGKDKPQLLVANHNSVIKSHYCVFLYSVLHSDPVPKAQVPQFAACATEYCIQNITD